MMPAKAGTFQAALENLKLLPPPDEEHPDDTKHAQLYLENFTDDRDLDGKAPPGADRKVALRWLLAALSQFSEGDHRYHEPAKYLLGSFRLWTDPGNAKEKEFVKVKKFAEAKLDKIGIVYEKDAYVALKLHDKLGDLGQDVPPARPRQDHWLPYPKVTFKQDEVPEEVEDAEDMFYIAFLITAVHALDPLYQKETQKICEAAGGNFKAPAPKGFMRCTAKLTTDHAGAKFPKAAENIDTNRAAWIFDEPEQLREAYEGAQRVFGPPLRVKNGYNKAFDALKISKGYRNTLANYRFAPEGLTWGELAGRKETAEQWKKLRQKMLDQFLGMGYATEDSMHDEWKFYLHLFDQAAAVIRSREMRDKPVVLVVEVQYMLSQYMSMRKKTHAWYKIARADNAESLVWDYLLN